MFSRMTTIRTGGHGRGKARNRYNRPAKLHGIATRTVTPVTDNDTRRECWTAGGWNLAADDDAPRPPEPDPLTSAQARRAAAQQDAAL